MEGMRTVTESDGISQSCLVLEPGAPTYAQLLIERDKLLKENARLVGMMSRRTVEDRKNELWGCVEDIACGATLSCPKCHKSKPCCCD
jgi:hypothetical protein